mmetsp:Transcript_31248/g.85811  ORF Transcript_31248/g.85811 Transcript_31248/m.85811 type:complete len:238 (+) Transcript_31248:693-1406(+)
MCPTTLAENLREAGLRETIPRRSDASTRTSRTPSTTRCIPRRLQIGARSPVRCTTRTRATWGDAGRRKTSPTSSGFRWASGVRSEESGRSSSPRLGALSSTFGARSPPGTGTIGGTQMSPPRTGSRLSAIPSCSTSNAPRGPISIRHASRSTKMSALAGIPRIFCSRAPRSPAAGDPGIPATAAQAARGEVTSRRPTTASGRTSARRSSARPRALHRRSSLHGPAALPVATFRTAPR